MPLVQSSLQNDQFVVAKRKVTKRVDRSPPHKEAGEKRTKTPMKVKKKKTKEKKNKKKVQARDTGIEGDMEVPKKYGSPYKKTSLHETGAGD